MKPYKDALMQITVADVGNGIIIDESSTSLAVFYKVRRRFHLCRWTHCKEKSSRSCEDKTFKSQLRTYLLTFKISTSFSTVSDALQRYINRLTILFFLVFFSIF